MSASPSHRQLPSTRTGSRPAALEPAPSGRAGWLVVWVALLALGAALLCAACQGCRGPRRATDGASPLVRAEGPPSVRLYLLSTLSGALEPCGCAADQLGGIDHLAAVLAAGEPQAPHRLLLAAGPLFFVDPKSEPDRAVQDGFKAEALASALRAMGLAGWAPGFNDWAAGREKLGRLSRSCGGSMLGLGLSGTDAVASRLFHAGSLGVGVVGISTPAGPLGGTPTGVTAPAASALVGALRSELAKLRARGARLLVVLAAMQRGAALRLAESVPGIGVLLVGAPLSPGDGNTDQPAPEMIGETLVIETANHGQAVALVDVYARAGGEGVLRLSDGGAVKRAAERQAIERRISDLQRRIQGWEKNGKVAAADLAARKVELDKLRARRDQLANAPPPPPTGSYFRFRVERIGEAAGSDATVAGIMDRYYRRVGEHNKRAFAERKAVPPGPDEAGYLGAAACASCHTAAYRVWRATAHARAYATLSKGHKEYNLECVSCHLTGYGKPGGSTVTDNAKLQSVQCESCHGPGSKHARRPAGEGLITRAPAPTDCRERCHHPPHVEHFDPQEKLPRILGPGHGG